MSIRTKGEAVFVVLLLTVLGVGTYKTYGLMERGRAKGEAKFIVDSAVDASCLALHRSAKLTPENKSTIEARVTANWTRNPDPQSRRWEYPLNFAQGDIGENANFHFTVDDSRAVLMHWPANLRKAVDDEVRRRVVLNSTSAPEVAHENCGAVLFRIDPSLLNYVLAHGQYQPAQGR